MQLLGLKPTQTSLIHPSKISNVLTAHHRLTNQSNLSMKILQLFCRKKIHFSANIQKLGAVKTSKNEMYSHRF